MGVARLPITPYKNNCSLGRVRMLQKLSPPWGSSPTRHLLKGPGMKECSQLTSSSNSKFCNDKNSERDHT